MTCRRIGSTFVMTTALAVFGTAATAHAQAPTPPPTPAPAPAPAATTTAPPATATDKAAGDPQAHFQRGIELYQEQDYAGALVELRRSYELAPTYKMLYNIGQVCYQLADYACALRSFDSYLRQGGPSVSSERRADVEREIKKLTGRVGRLEVSSNVAGVEVLVDDVPVGKTPFNEPLVVSAGKRRITATHEGYAPVARIVEVAGTDSMRVDLTMTSATAGGERAAPVYESRWNTVSWIGLGATAVFAAGAAVTGIIALDASDKLADQRFAVGSGPSPDMTSEQDRAKTFSIVSDVCTGLAAVSLVGTLVYTFARTPKQVEGDRRAAVKPTINVGISPRGAALGGTF